MKKKPGLKTWTVWLRNHTSRDDDETIKVKARTAEEAASKAQYDTSRFSIRAVLSAKEARCNWYG